ncbi:diphosphate--fructose-6-phosphate 1-phosphotransferase [Chitinispirillales bacterium ANBcel5]|uniref:diphosphate--fructose-6-phosphate 1-phosphotransferase n=1 Tax=Cellulosispirillum alkaliphilum TaxID=3039283 RepID=UPI002A5909CA|nr:diphosphate--fructose-6-phosphate 1-phosphotransferase [Chitinispirillales bacterium ANBcel5]
MSKSISPLQSARAAYKPKLPKVLAEHGSAVNASVGDPTESVGDQAEVKELFPNTYGLPVVNFDAPAQGKIGALKVGVILSGGQAPGGHNVIAGLYDGLNKIDSGSELFGFLGGPSGLIDNEYVKFDDELIGRFRNTGGFDIIGSGRTKLETEEQFDKVIENCKTLGITALVVIGGDDSNTNACMLAEYCLKKESGIQVIGCPKTIDGDLKNEWIEASFGFDTATKVYSELIGNIQRDANSAKKYWHFIKLMGRSASHIALECALKTHPNVTIISEEVAEKKKTLREIVTEIATIVKKRADAGKNFGIALIPEGLIEFVPEMKKLISELNDLLAENATYFDSLLDDDKFQFVNSKLGADTSHVFSSLPQSIQYQLLADRDPHGNVQVSRIETEKLLIDMVSDLLREWKVKGNFSGKFNALNHFFGYEGRCAAPSNFDADYCYSLGYTASALIGAGKTGYLSSVRNLTEPADQWIAGGIPLTMMMNLERRHGKDKPVIKKALVELHGKPFHEYAYNREAWALEDDYIYPGPIQYFGPSEVCDITTDTIQLEKK